MNTPPSGPPPPAGSTPPPGEYMRPPNQMGGYNGPPGVYQNDKVVGIILMVLSLCGAAGSLMLVVGGGILTAAGAAGAATARGTAGAAAVGGMVAVIGILLLIVSLLSVAIGYGISKSLKWAFQGGLILYIIHALLDLANFRSGMFGLAIAVGMIVYCYMRLNGKLGPVPVA